MSPTHILLIEDDPAIAHSLQTGLREEGYAMTWQKNGRDGLHFAYTHQPHLIILRAPKSRRVFCGAAAVIQLRPVRSAPAGGKCRWPGS